MIVRKTFQIHTAIRFSWKNIVISTICAALAYASHHAYGSDGFVVPISVVAILGTALAIILGFKNSSSYDRWWEARKIWGGIVNESRTLTRQVLTIVDPKNVPPALWADSVQVVNRQIAWINALRLQLRGVTDTEEWKQHVARHLSEADFTFIMLKTNKVTHLAMLQGDQIKEMNAREDLDTFSYIQMDDTLTRLTDLQGRCERIKSTPLPRPYDYYTMAFLNLFIFFFPFAFIKELLNLGEDYLIFPITILVGWMFYQIYVLGKVLASPFDNMKTDVAMNAICTTIEIDLKEIVGDKNVPEPLKAEKGVLM
jgi:ion channel-forming bestrophin family protein